MVGGASGIIAWPFIEVTVQALSASVTCDEGLGDGAAGRLDAALDGVQPMATIEMRARTVASRRMSRDGTCSSRWRPAG
jgi:hypothetical protein